MFIGALFRHKGSVCVACNGSGKSTFGGTCRWCMGTGKY